MRAPRWFREYSEWRWAPTLALTLAALTFIALALLLIPNQVVPAPNATAGAEFRARSAQLARSAQPAPLAASPVVEPRAFEEPRANAGALPAVQLAPPPATTENLPAVANPPDFAANIADRADRPGVSAAPR